MARTRAKHPAVFIDRDGTLIREKNYLCRTGDVRLIKGTVPALKSLRDAGYKLVLVTNQSGIGRGYFTEAQLAKVHAHLARLLENKGVPLDGIYYCPHHPDATCSCRKPKPGMVKQAARELGIDLKKSYTVGDHPGDFLLGQNMGGKGVFVLTGHGRKEHGKLKSGEKQGTPDKVARDLAAAARWILAQNR